MQSLSAQQQDEVRALIALMKDPRYWRDQDPEVIQTVRTGLRRIYLERPRAEPPARSFGEIVPRWFRPGEARARAG